MFRIINKLKNRKGFTLIELIVVLAVLAIIMAIAIPRFMGVQEDAKEDADYSTAAMIAKSAELYYARENETEADFDDLVSVGYIDDDIKLQSNDSELTNSMVDIDYSTSTGAVTVELKSSSGGAVIASYPDNR